MKSIRQRAHKEEKLIKEAKELAQALLALEVRIQAKVGVGDRLFGSINNIDVAENLSRQGHKIERKFIRVRGGNVKRTGNHQALIRLHRDLEIEMPFEVVPEAK